MDFSLKHSFELLLGIIVITFFLTYFNDFTYQFEDKPLIQETTHPKVQTLHTQIELEVQPIALKVGQDYSLYDYVTVNQEAGTLWKENLKIYDNINILQPGYYKARFVLQTETGNYYDKIAEVRVDG